MSWHRSYEEHVLGADYRFALTHLRVHTIDALTAHVRTVGRLPAAAEQAPLLERLQRALAAQRASELPPREAGVPDLYFALQREVACEVGEEALGWLRLGLSRNDLDMTVYRLRAREIALGTLRQLLMLQRALFASAEANLDRIMVASTHHRPAQPTTFAHYLAAVASVLDRDLQRASQALTRLDLCPMGAAALAGSSHPLDRAFTAQLLGFAGPVESTYDAVASSDWQLDIAAVATSVAIAMSRLIADLIEWTARGWLIVADALTQGSSIMPQKRNPVPLEHARARFSRALGAAQMVVLSSHNIPFADLNDFGPDVQGALQTLHAQVAGGVALVQACLTESAFGDSAISDSVAGTDTTATELADELVRITGRPFQEAHRWVAQVLARLAEERRPFQQVEPADLVAVGAPEIPRVALKEAVSPQAFVVRRSGIGGPAPAAVRDHLRRLRERSDGYHEAVRLVTARIEASQRVLRATGKEA